jgi:hypothetical protein
MLSRERPRRRGPTPVTAHPTLGTLASVTPDKQPDDPRRRVSGEGQDPPTEPLRPPVGREPPEGSPPAPAGRRSEGPEEPLPAHGERSETPAEPLPRPEDLSERPEDPLPRPEPLLDPPGGPLWADAGEEPSADEHPPDPSPPDPSTAAGDEHAEDAPAESAGAPRDPVRSRRSRPDPKPAPAQPLGLTGSTTGSPGTNADWERAKVWFDGSSWAFRGAVIVLIAVLLMLIIPARGATQYKSAAGFTSLAGFTFLAAALERIAEFVLAPWWGLVPTKTVAAALGTANALSASHASRAATAGSASVHTAPVPAKVGVSGAAVLRASARSARSSAQQALERAPRGQTSDEAKEIVSGAHEASTAATRASGASTAARRASEASTAATHASEAADDLYVQATKQRPTIILPMAAAAGLLCYCLHLFLLHSLARSGVSRTHLAYVVDGLVTGFAIAGGAQPFHDLLSGLTTSAAAKKAAVGSSSPTA